MTHTLDAKDQSLGRLASKIAVILRGKNNPAFQPNLLPKDKVVVSNIKEIKFLGTKLATKKYFHYSGYPGGMKTRALATYFEKNPKKVLWLAVYRMLAKNRMRDKIIKNLAIN